jgi:hypothetical protein
MNSITELPRLAIDKRLTSKVSKRHLRIYGENLIHDIILSKNYEDFNENKRFKIFYDKKIDKYKKVKYKTFYDIKRAYFIWTIEEDNEELE